VARSVADPHHLVKDRQPAASQLPIHRLDQSLNCDVNSSRGSAQQPLGRDANHERQAQLPGEPSREAGLCRLPVQSEGIVLSLAARVQDGASRCDGRALGLARRHQRNISASVRSDMFTSGKKRLGLDFGLGS